MLLPHEFYIWEGLVNILTLLLTSWKGLRMIYTEVLHALDAPQLLYLSLKCYLIDILHDNLKKEEKSPINSCINQVISTMSWSNDSVTVFLTVTSPVLETLCRQVLTTVAHLRLSSLACALALNYDCFHLQGREITMTLCPDYR